MTKINCPIGSQLLFYPMVETTLAAGFKNTKYKKDYRYVHYGVDFDSRAAIDFNAIASGNGVVLGVEKNSNSIGGVVVIKYPKVYNPKTKKSLDLIVRIYHLNTIKVKKGSKVVPYQVIGTVSGTHRWWNHIHFEIDKDTKYPFHTPQVAEASSKLLIRKGASALSLLNPMDVLVIGNKQSAIIHPRAVYVDEIKDAPKWEE